jgi:prophage regulatory protein
VPQNILRLPQVKVRVGLSRSSIYAAMADGRFPSSIELGPRAVGWLDSEIDAWLMQQMESSRSPR